MSSVKAFRGVPCWFAWSWNGSARPAASTATGSEGIEDRATWLGGMDFRAAGRSVTAVGVGGEAGDTRDSERVKESSRPLVGVGGRGGAALAPPDVVRARERIVATGGRWGVSGGAALAPPEVESVRASVADVVSRVKTTRAS